jgi:hypothetical protein
MKKSALVLLVVVTLLAISLSSAGSRKVTTTEPCSAPAPTPTPTVVPGTELQGRVAKTKPGYQFVKQAVGVTVENTRTNQYMGAYTCPCHSTDPNRKCELIFSPTYITCKNGSCGSDGGSCLLVGATPMMRQ